jgi:hypothetical protein
MSIFNIRYSRLNFSYDKKKLSDEINHYEFTDIPPIKQFLNTRPFNLVDNSLYEKVTLITETGITQGELPSWKGYSFTHVPGDLLSSYGSNLSRMRFENWEWKEDSECPYIRQIISDLGFIKVQNVRAMSLEPPGFGPVHNDVPPHSKYYDNHVSVTLNISDGGMPLTALIDDKLLEINDDCFMFRDDCWHGVGLVTSKRLQLRINGIVDERHFNEILSRN